MGMFKLLLGKKAAAKVHPSKGAPHSTQFVPSQLSQQTPGSVHSVRKDLLKLVLRETLTRNGIPGPWMSVDLLRTSTSKREQGIHVRFLMRHWDPRVMQYGPSLEQEYMQRLLLLDPTARTWLMGFSWQFAMDDHSVCPPLPHPNSWTTPRDNEPRPVAAAAPVEESGDVIQGPVMIPKPLDDVRADLERLLALRDDDIRRHVAGHPGDNFAATRPATL
jgi:hypothetical protein